VSPLNFNESAAVYEALFPGSPFFTTWIPREGFISSQSEGANFSVTRNGDKSFGFAFGDTPIFDPKWQSCSIETRGVAHLPPHFEVIDQWDCYWAPTQEGSYSSEGEATDRDIENFLMEHAPDSSVFPGNHEILQWVQIHERGELLAVAALCRWESGKVVISSVGTHSQHRGRGLGKELMRRALISGRELGEEHLSLGVMHENESAQRLYAAAGFTLMHRFTFCERR